MNQRLNLLPVLLALCQQVHRLVSIVVLDVAHVAQYLVAFGVPTEQRQGALVSVAQLCLTRGLLPPRMPVLARHALCPRETIKLDYQ